MTHPPVDKQELAGLWPADAGADEHEFSRFTGEVAQAVYRARLEGNAGAAQHMFDCLAAARDVWTREPQASVLDIAYAQACRTLADWAVCEHRLEEGLALAALGWQVLERKNRRRQMMGLQPAYNTTVRIQLLGAASDAKWRLDESHQDDVLPAAGHCPLYLTLADRVREAETSGTLKPDQRQQLALGLLWTGLWVAALHLRFQLPGLEELASECNAWHESLLGHKAILLGHTPPAAGMERSPWFWHFEIVKVYVDCKLAHSPSPAALAQLAFLYDQLDAAVRKCPQFFPDVAYAQSLQRDRQWMEQALEQRKSATG